MNLGGKAVLGFFPLPLTEARRLRKQPAFTGCLGFECFVEWQVNETLDEVFVNVLLKTAGLMLKELAQKSDPFPEPLFCAKR